jgi:hypothetical protein
MVLEWAQRSVLRWAIAMDSEMVHPKETPSETRTERRLGTMTVNRLDLELVLRKADMMANATATVSETTAKDPSREI